MFGWDARRSRIELPCSLVLVDAVRQRNAPEVPAKVLALCKQNDVRLRRDSASVRATAGRSP